MKKINSIIDYTLLNELASKDELASVCKNAIKLGVKSVCVYPKHVTYVKDQLKGSDILVCTVISFPHGTNSFESKYNETLKALRDGAVEIDMVLDYKMLIKYWDSYNGITNTDTDKYLSREINQLGELCHSNDAILKVIIESGSLTIPQTIYATKLCIVNKADFIKTSTGKTSTGAELDKVKAMRHTISERWSLLQIKVSGGIRTLEDIKSYKRYVNRFGMGYGSVDSINGAITLEFGQIY